MKQCLNISCIPNMQIAYCLRFSRMKPPASVSDGFSRHIIYRISEPHQMLRTGTDLMKIPPAKTRNSLPEMAQTQSNISEQASQGHMENARHRIYRTASTGTLHRLHTWMGRAKQCIRFLFHSVRIIPLHSLHL